MSAEMLTEQELDDARGVASAYRHQSIHKLLRAYESLTAQVTTLTAELASNTREFGRLYGEQDKSRAGAYQRIEALESENERQRLLNGAEHNQLVSERAAHEQTKARVAHLEQVLDEQAASIYHTTNRMLAAESALASARSLLERVDAALEEDGPWLKVQVDLRHWLSSHPAPVAAPSGDAQDRAVMVGDDLSAHPGSGRLLASKPVAAPCAGCAALCEMMLAESGARQDLTQAIDAAVKRLARINGRTDALEMHECVDDAIAALRAARKGQP